MLTFKIEQGLGLFVPADQAEADRQAEELNRILAEADSEDINTKKIINETKAMTEKNPLFLRGYALLAEIFLNLGQEDEAAQACVNGCKEALKIIPGDFSGPMDTNNPEVQCFLRCHTGYVESLMGEEKYAQALEAVKRQLIFDPEDNFERRRELGELAIMAGRLDEAESCLLERIHEYPTAWYSLAFLAFKKGEYALAAASLRRGLLMAPYAGDFLTARFTSSNIFWNSGPNAPSYQEELLYLHTLGGEMWSGDEKAQAFLEWLSQSSVALRERSEMAALAEGCLAKGEVDQTAADTFQALLDSIDEKSSIPLTAKIKDPLTGDLIEPWELLVRHQKRSENEGESFEEGCGCGS